MTINYSSTRETVELMNARREPTSVALPDGINFFRLESVGSYQIDVLPFVTSTKPEYKNPFCKTPGNVHPERTYWAHKNLGLEGKSSYCCLAKTFNLPCPICVWMQKNSNGDQDLLQSLQPQQRMLFAVINLAQKDKGIQVWDVAYFKSFGQMLATKLKASRKFENWFHLKGGMTLDLIVEEKKLPRGSFKNVVNIEMVERDHDYSEDMLTKVPCLDECLVRMDYEKLKRIFLQEPEEAAPAASNAQAASARSEPRPEPRTEPAPANKVAPRTAEEPPVRRVHDIGPGDFVKHAGLGRCTVAKTFDTDEGKTVWLRDLQAVVHKEYAKATILAESLELEDDE